jgi:hypothetical protein
MARTVGRRRRVTPAGGRIYRYYVTREAIADGYDTCPLRSVPVANGQALCWTTSRSYARA